MSTTNNTRILMRRRTAAQWTALNEVLMEGEIGVILDSNPKKFKIGDGITEWSQLPLSYPTIIGENGNLIVVDTYDQAVPLFTGTSQKRIYVLTDYTYNDGDKSFYDYVPGVGVAFMGLDFNYTD